MLLQTAVGDAYGAGFEYAAADFVALHNTLASHVKHPKHNLVPGVYTDDTQMALAIAEVITSGQPFTRENLAEAFVQGFHRDQREGYASGFYAFLCEQTLGIRPSEVRLMYLKDQVVVVDSPTDQSMRGLTQRASAVWSAIERACDREDFRPNPTPLCKSCAFQTLCPAFNGATKELALTD